MEYFKLVKWMIFLNLLLSLVVFFIIIPQFVMSPQKFDDRWQHPEAVIAQPLIARAGQSRFSYIAL